MTSIDYIVLAIYLLGILAVGCVFARVNKSSADMFAAGGQSPWWAAGLSSFMTMFSANTFVVWGGIAYKHGLVAVAINLGYGVAALLVGYFVAGHWKTLGIRTPAEYVRLRFGTGALHFYTWSLMAFRLIGVGAALYALSRLVVALMPLEVDNFLRDAATGNLSLNWAILLFGGSIVVYTMLGGLWAVLMTDVVQFIVLNLAVLFVIPLLLMKSGGVGQFVELAPEGFFSPVGGGYTWFFLAGWCAIHFFMIGAEWAFVQRFLCVRTPRDARKGTYLFGLLYLVSPFIWLMPPLLWRVQQPIPAGATSGEIQLMAEQAYILACQAVLPAGMVGLMLAAMFSATASMISSQLNVFAGVLTNDLYRPWAGTGASERHLVWFGRFSTLLLGGIVLSIAIAVPFLGGAENLIIAAGFLMVVPLLGPLVWGLFDRRLGASAVWTTSAICIPLGVVFLAASTVVDSTAPSSLQEWLVLHERTLSIVVGVVLPVALLGLLHFTSTNSAPGWGRLAAATLPAQPAVGVRSEGNRLSTLVVGWCLGGCGATMAALAVFNQADRMVLGVFAAVLVLIAAVILVRSHTQKTI